MNEGITSPAPLSQAIPYNWRELASVEPNLISAKTLMRRKADSPRWAVAGLIADGVALLVGAPKLGKSWMALNLSLSVARGERALDNDRLTTEAGAVLYMALEDGERRIRSRLAMNLGGRKNIPSRLVFGTRWDRFGPEDRGLNDLAEWVSAENPSLVVIDTWAKVMPQGGGMFYGNDYSAIGALKQLADSTRTPIVLVHHQRKAPSRSGDPLETVGGSTGLTGAVDTVMILDRERGSSTATLFVTGRDVDESVWPMTFHPGSGRWVAGNPGEAPSDD